MSWTYRVVRDNQGPPKLPEMTDIWRQTLDWQPTPQQQSLFQRLYELILAGNRQLNLTRITEPEEFWEKHLWDCLRGIKQFLGTSKKLVVIDIGTGAGFPGIPTAITVANCTVDLLDSTQKKITFIEKTLTELNVNNIRTITGRAEEIGQMRLHREKYDVALIRAVAAVTVCAEYALPLLKQNGLAVIYRGTWAPEENLALGNAVEELGGVIEDIEEFTTPLTNSIRHCIYLRKVSHTPVKYPRAVGVPTQRPL
ncbi:MAG: 16S rRNA (guanine(527)-N(7))-methyltransferase RsmG [Calothrix sp. C42_A2020_038]|nr:16S rRNA (guanine(527)-N(7))-methyltransferase RsmG [Calothrix sp. C42_A2020_038]